MIEAIIFLVGLGAGAAGTVAAIAILSTRRLPPATRRQLDRARRANRLEIRSRSHPPRWVPDAESSYPSLDAFDVEPTKEVTPP